MELRLSKFHIAIIQITGYAQDAKQGIKMSKIKEEEIRHKNKMKEIEAEKQAKIEVENLKFDYSLQLQRIRSAEIKRSIDRNQWKGFSESTK